LIILLMVRMIDRSIMMIMMTMTRSCYADRDIDQSMTIIVLNMVRMQIDESISGAGYADSTRA
jgi:hypothetical protein